MIRRIFVIVLLAFLPLYAASQETTGGRSYQSLFPPVSNVGNGADTTEDTLQSLSVAAGQLANVGDQLHIVAGGVLGATTDSKVVRIKFGGTVVAAQTSTTVGQTAWSARVEVLKTAANSQVITSMMANSNAVVGNAVSPSITDTSVIIVLVTGQNSTNSVASSIQCRYLTVSYIPVGP